MFGWIVVIISIVIVLNIVQARVIYMPTKSEKGNWKYGNLHNEEEDEEDNNIFLFFHGNMGNSKVQCPRDLINSVDGKFYIFEYPGYGYNYGKSINKSNIITEASKALKSIATTDKKIYLIGQSLGSGVASELANLHPELVKGVVLITPYTRMMDVVNNYLPVGYFLFRHRYNSIDNLKEYTKKGGSALIIGAKQDEVTPFAHSVAIAAECDVKLIAFDGGHNDFSTFKNVWREELDHWIDQVQEKDLP